MTEFIGWHMPQQHIFCSIAAQAEKAPLRKDIVLDTELKLFICCWLGMVVVGGSPSYPRALWGMNTKNSDEISHRYVSDDENNGNVA